jgi:hypothetical protein
MCYIYSERSVYASSAAFPGFSSNPPDISAVISGDFPMHRSADFLFSRLETDRKDSPKSFFSRLPGLFQTQRLLRLSPSNAFTTSRFTAFFHLKIVQTVQCHSAQSRIFEYSDKSGPQDNCGTNQAIPGVIFFALTLKVAERHFMIIFYYVDRNIKN